MRSLRLDAATRYSTHYRLLALVAMTSAGVAWGQTRPGGPSLGGQEPAGIVAPASTRGAAPAGPRVDMGPRAATPGFGPSPASPATHAAPAAGFPSSPAPATQAPAVQAVEPFKATITADRVYVRPAPGTQYYQLTQLKKDETVTVVGTTSGWYQIAPPAGVYCLIVKEYVESDADGKTGTVKADYVNVRAGSALNPNRSDVVLSVVRKGTKLTLDGTADIGGTKYYKVTPPEKTYVWVSSQFVKPAAGTVITPVKTSAAPPARGGETVVDIGPGPGAIESTNTTAAGNNTGAATTQTASTGPVVSPPVRATTVAATEPAVPPVPATRQVVVAPEPAVKFAPGAFEKFNDINKRTVAELGKPTLEQDPGSLLEEWNGFLKTENLPPSVKAAGQERVVALERALALQKAVKESRAQDATVAAKRQEFREQYEKSLEAVKAAENTGPYLAEGTLETSPVVAGRYALVNPITRRVVAYVDPSSDIPLEKLLGQYVGVRGGVTTPKDADIRVIKVKNATLIPAPKLGAVTGG